MIRTFLAKGDRAESAVITEGLDSVTCSNPPPAAHIATLGMKTYCSACKREGYIAPRGPRRPGTGPNGKQWALSGDINMCGCKPAPGQPLPDMPYCIVTEDGSELEGRTDAQGYTQRVAGDQAMSATLHVYEEETPINPDWDRYL
jgi:hypothetical protein